MKNMKFTLGIVSVALVFSSCTVLKRTYSDGYYVQWNHHTRQHEQNEAEAGAVNHPTQLTEYFPTSQNQSKVEQAQLPAPNRAESKPVNEIVSRSTSHTTPVLSHNIPFVKNNLHKVAKQTVKTKESSSKAMGILNSLLTILLCVIVLVLIIFLVSILI